MLCVTCAMQGEEFRILQHVNVAQQLEFFVSAHPAYEASGNSMMVFSQIKSRSADALCLIPLDLSISFFPFWPIK